MTYTMLAVAGVTGALGVDLVVLRTALVRRRVFWLTYLIVLGFQLLVNGILAGQGVVRYDERAVIGWRVGRAPVEDLLFGFALILLSQASWIWLGRRTGRFARPGRPAWAARPAPGRWPSRRPARR